ncbi:hypothetical protein [Halomonas campaniensis]|uniref:hypothetical protein n=1 Tax=Halomonas campaniensis TaxID=213554 RepID=UPI0035666AEC
MTPVDITMDIGARSLGDAIDRTRYAICKQVQSVESELATNYGPLALTSREQADLRQFLAKMLERRLAILEAQL